jgi:hypothetical protein
MIGVGSSPIVGDVVRCLNCGAELIVVWLNPIELDFAIYPKNREEKYEKTDDFENRIH